ncbi:FtsB family cell division protein [Acinetobacter sp. Ver3]|uniref:FtsB family cell division protein n=1 Tax=Acinetobacter sp. Ver3 TaxID=466088 RepID=UPI000446C9A3|nr:hypothetical protein [Acinetobacter sp. Ver3]EZQ10755.1 hypothetical protein CL42_06400 [Acinetobacter sp. Ver3]
MSEFKTLEEYQNSIKEFNAQSILGFEDFIINSNNDRAKLQLRCTPHTDKKCGYGCHDLDFGLSVWQHQQTKIDELQKENEKLKYERDAFQEFHRDCKVEIDLLKAEKAELEKRISKTLGMLDGDLSYVEEDRRRNFEFLQMVMIRCLKDDMKALRGES